MKLGFQTITGEIDAADKNGKEVLQLLKIMRFSLMSYNREIRYSENKSQYYRGNRRLSKEVHGKGFIDSEYQNPDKGSFNRARRL